MHAELLLEDLPQNHIQSFDQCPQEHSEFVVERIYGKRVN